MVRAVGSMLSPAGRKASLLVLIYHNVFASHDPLNPDEPDAGLFAAQMDLLKETFNVIGLEEAVAGLRAGNLPARALSITFDDGYANNCTIAAPILAKREMTATFFIATGYLNGGRMWNDTVVEALRRSGSHLDLGSLGLGSFDFPDAAARQRAAANLLAKLKYLPFERRLQIADSIASIVGAELPDDLMMSDEQVRQHKRMGMEVGAHTVTHPILTLSDTETVEREIRGSMDALEIILGDRVRTFAYPNGRPNRDYAAAHVDIARRCGLSLAVSTAWGCAKPGADPYQIPRVSPWDLTPERYAVRLLRAYLQEPPAVA